MRRSFLVVAAIAPLLGGCFFFGGPAPPELDRACLADLDNHAISYESIVLPEAHDPQCTVDTAVRVERLEARLRHPATMSCAMASRFDRFEREAVEPLARRDLGRSVAQIEHFGAYACRANTSKRGVLSEHAYGRAFDIAGFRFSDGTTANVARDWRRPGPVRDFLHDVARNACRYFSVVLTPDSNRDHYNHLHLDIGRYRVCSAGV